jgi:hypothetical protein
MSHRSTWPLRIVYVIVLLSILLPIGLSGSGWVSLSLGRGGWRSLWQYAFVALFVVLAIWRIWVVLADRSTLDSPAVAGLLRAIRITGVTLLSLGTLVFALDVLGRPIIRALVSRPSESGVEFYVVGLFLAFLKGIGPLGVIVFEFSRLRSFEKLGYLGDS